MPGSLHVGRQSMQQRCRATAGNSFFPLQGEICLSHSLSDVAGRLMLCKGTARSARRWENKIAFLPWRNMHQNPAACQSGCRGSWPTPATLSCFRSCEFNKSSIKITLIYKSRQAKWHFYYRAQTTGRFPDAAANQCNLHHHAVFSL